MGLRISKVCENRPNDFSAPTKMIFSTPLYHDEEPNLKKFLFFPRISKTMGGGIHPLF